LWVATRPVRVPAIVELYTAPLMAVQATVVETAEAEATPSRVSRLATRCICQVVLVPMGATLVAAVAFICSRRGTCVAS